MAMALDGISKTSCSVSPAPSSWAAWRTPCWWRPPASPGSSPRMRVCRWSWYCKTLFFFTFASDINHFFFLKDKCIVNEQNKSFLICLKYHRVCSKSVLISFMITDALQVWAPRRVCVTLTSATSAPAPASLSSLQWTPRLSTPPTSPPPRRGPGPGRGGSPPRRDGPRLPRQHPHPRR